MAETEPPEGPPGRGLTRLPNGLEVAYQRLPELEHLYRDIFEHRVYLRHGLRLPERATVFDVGANVGLFTLFVARERPEARILAFEPSPPLFEILSFNSGRWAPRAVLVPAGVSKREGRAALTFYPESSGMSSFYADREEEREALRAILDNEAREGVEAARALLPHAEEYLDRRLESRTFDCELTTLSAAVRAHGVERIDLLKVDVQKAELDVLSSLDEADWPRVRQLVVEVHDLGGRLEAMRALLSGRGFQVTAEQDPLYAGSPIHNLYARRPEKIVLAGATEARGRGWRPLPVAAPDEASLEATLGRLAERLEAEPSLFEAAAAGEMAGEEPCRAFAVVENGADAAAVLAGAEPRRLLRGLAPAEAPAVAFLLPGLGDQLPGMGAELYRLEPAFREALDRCAELLHPYLGEDIRRRLFPAETPGAGTAEGGLDLRRLLGRGAAGGAGGTGAVGELDRTVHAQPAVFAVEYALARLWQSWGVGPRALAGFSLGELTAACLAGVMALEDAARLVALRAVMIERLPAGSMLAVSAPEPTVRPALEGLGERVSVSASIGPEVTVVAGEPAAVEALGARLGEAGIVWRRLATTHAFHSRMMEPLVAPFAKIAATARLAAPEIPYLTNVTGTWATSEQATDPSHWARHLVAPVRFGEILEELWRAPDRLFLEVGPGQALGAWALQHPASRAGSAVVSSLGHRHEEGSEQAHLLTAAGRLWLAGCALDWRSVAASTEEPPAAEPAAAEGRESEALGEEELREILEKERLAVG